MHLDGILKNLPALFSALFVAILFIQSGLDKVLDWKGNLEWLTGHFSKTFVSGVVPLMLAKITILELLTGLTAAVGIVYFFVAGSTIVIFYSSILGAATITGLFLGQRVAKDYAGAAVLVPYFLLDLIMMFLTSV
ncbi:MAG TPA: hypothetical protein PLP07_02875 [Pyrinomonadaceae bacterium]|jgi:hypothetical protein|nr:DoxX family protein [Chloracidobacterium sp.]MBP9935464.1 hypothetical protein [Pyrinomonadaceae bacterium]MBK7801920.1 DoxX family protein [Chloracidobacterium sp.]MBK9437936.1 DoxX family protein [Chloracidobacterium sp.]MBK9765637.1 DoxX family protein [Chloracidobacterium sp.]